MKHSHGHLTTLTQLKWKRNKLTNWDNQSPWMCLLVELYGLDQSSLVFHGKWICPTLFFNLQLLPTFLRSVFQQLTDVQTGFLWLELGSQVDSTDHVLLIISNTMRAEQAGVIANRRFMSTQKHAVTKITLWNCTYLWYYRIDNFRLAYGLALLRTFVV